MATGVTTLQELQDKFASGKGAILKYQTANVSGSTVSALSGNLISEPLFHNIGSTLFSVLQETPIPPGITGPLRVMAAVGAASASRNPSICLGILYEVGTQTLTSTGTGNFTHSSATFPIQRTKNGSATDLGLIPFFLVTTATSTTAPKIKINYVDGQGNSRTGTKEVTFPAATTNAGCFIKMPLEDGDATVKDITGCDVVTASSAGAGTFYLFEPLAPFMGGLTTTGANRNFITQGWNLADIQPGTATSGSATSYRVPLFFGVATGTDIKFFLTLVNDV